MTRFEPTLIVNRLIIERNGTAVYDEHFHAGVNIIRGENASGKSTILNFLYYGLGGDLTDWSEIAQLCTRVLVEVSLNGKIATLSREVSTQRGQAMDVFGGDFSTAQKAPRDEWIRYPYARSASKESFSQAIFRLLKIPEVANEISGNLTMNQILRLLYADQLSPVDSIFKFDTVFDSPLLRDAVGRLLCGAYDSTLYLNELEIRALQREFDTASGELRSLFAVLGTGDQGLTLEWIAGERHVLEEERRSIQIQIEEAERRIFTSTADDELTLAAQEEAYEHVQALQAELGAARQDRDSLALNIADSAAFIASLQSKIEALNDAAEVAKHIGEVRFHACPACYAPLLDEEQPTHACHLCKTPFDAERSKFR
jgi:DNA repair exonuclease SbcCD ATPase subunit